MNSDEDGSQHPDFDYGELIRNRCLRLIEWGVARTDREVVRHASGAPPDLVTAFLRALDKGILPNNNAEVSSVIKERHREASAAIRRLPDPHPAEYDWRFTDETVVSLAEKATQSAGGQDIAVLGAKTLFMQLREDGHRTVMLYERSQSQLQDLNDLGFSDGLVHHDLFNPITGRTGSFRVVVADPPWYPEYYVAFLVRASEILQIGGRLLIALLPSLTRPSAAVDRYTFLREARRLGLTLKQISAEAVRYETPPFERQVLFIHGLNCPDWRAADLCIFEKTTEPTLVSLARPDEAEWDDFRLGRTKIKVRRRATPDSPFLFGPADPHGLLLRSVSRRFPLRSKIDVWTSDNLAFSFDHGLNIARRAIALRQQLSIPKTLERMVAMDGLSPSDEGEVRRFLCQLDRGISI